MADYELAKAYVQIIPTTKGIAGELSSVLGGEGEKAGEAGGKGIASGLKSAAGAMGKAAIAGLSAASAGLVAFGKSAVGAGSDFDEAMSQVMATMGFSVEDIQTEGSAAQTAMQSLRKFAQQQGATTAFSATQAAEALNYMALAGYDVDKSMDMLPTVLSLAAAGAMDLGSASDMVTDAQSAFGLSAKETKTMVDQMAKTASKSNTSVSQLGEAYLKIGATARSVKGGTKELSTVLGVLADNGIKGSEGGTHLRNILLSLQNPTDKARGVMEGLGIQVYDSGGNMRSMIDIIGDMQLSMGDMTEEARTAAITGIFNKTDLSSVNALLGTTKQRFEELGTEIGDSKDAAEEMAAVQLDNLQGDVTLFKSALEGVQISLSDSLTPELRNFVKIGTKGLGEIQKALEEEGIAGAAGALGDLIGELIVQFAEDLPKLVTAGGQMLSAIADGFIKALPELAKGLPQMVTAMVGLVTSVISSLSTTLPALVRSLLDALPAIITVLLEAVPTLITSICGAVPEIITAVIEMLPQAMLDIGAAIITNFPVIVGAIFEGLGSILTGVGQWFGSLLGIVSTNREEISKQVAQENAALTAFVDALKDTEPQLADYNVILSDSGESLGDLNTKISETESAITTTLKEALASQQGLREEDLQKIQAYTDELVRLEEEKLTIYRSQQKAQLQKLALETNQIDQQSAAQHLANVTAALDNANKVTEEAYEGRLITIENKYTAMGQVGSQAYKDEMAAAKTWHDNEIKENQKYADDALKILNKNAKSWVGADAKKWSDLANNFARFRKDEEKSYINRDGRVKEVLRAADEEFAQALADMDETAINGFLRMAASTKSAGGTLDKETKQIASDFIKAFDGLPKELDEAGKDSLLGFIYGMEDQIPGLEKASEMSSQEIVDTIKDFMDIESPSKVMSEIGGYVTEGLAGGITGKEGTLTTAMKGIGGKLSATKNWGISNPSTLLKTMGSDMIAGIGSGINGKKDALGTTMGTIGTKLSANRNWGVANASNLLKSMGTNAISGLQSGINGKKEGLGTTMGTIGTKLSRTGNWGVLESGKKLLRTLGENAIGGLQGGIKDRREALGTTMGTIGTKLSRTGNWGVDKPESLLTGMGTKILDSLRNGVKDETKTKSLTDSMQSLGTQMGAGVATGFANQEDNIWKKMSTVIKNVKLAAERQLEISSPSRVFMRIGEMTGAGLAVGIEESSYEAVGAAIDMADGINEATADVLQADYNAAITVADASLRSGLAAAAAGERTGESILTDLLGIVRELYARLDRMQVVLDTGQLVGGIRNQMDEAIGASSTMIGRGVAV